MFESTADKQLKGGKLNPAWLGPYTICKAYGKDVYQLFNQSGREIWNKVNVNRLKPYKKRSNDQDSRKYQPPLKKQCRQENENQLKEQSSCKGKGKSRRAPGKQQINEQLAKEILARTELTDQHMTFAYTLLKQQYPELDGLQSTLLSQVNNFHPVGSGCNSIQLHHTGQFHWVTSVLISGKIHLYDSKFSGGPLSSSLQVQLPLTYKTSIVKEVNTKFYLC